MQSNLAEKTNDFVLNLIPAQAGFLYGKAIFPAFVASWGTGKSTMGIMKAMHLSEKYPNNLGVIFRKEFTDLRDSTLKDFENYTQLKVGSNREVVLPNGSQILFRHLEELNNIQNMNLGWFWLEQAEEVETDEPFFILYGRLRRKGMPPRGFITANTNGQNWIYKLWKAGGLEETVEKLLKENPDLYPGVRSAREVVTLFEANTYENALNLPKSFLANLEIIKATKPTIYNRFVLNSWSDSDTIDIIIKPEHIAKAIGKDIGVVPPFKGVVSIDVARYGDKTVFYALENNVVLAKEVHEKKSTMETVGLATIFAKKHKIDAFAVDEIGVGGGVGDRLVELEHQVIFVNAAQKEGVRTDCFNRRAEIYLNGSEIFEAGKVSILKEDKDLIEQLSWAKYKTIKSNGVYQVEPKDDIKKRFGRSPDNADAFLNGLWALPQVKTKKEEDKYQKSFNKKRETVGSGMTI
jgi:phage terminase large subunit